jgi:hypothetical protein
MKHTRMTNKVFIPETDKEFIERQDARDCEAFERLRAYFRLNFTDGASDAAFLRWCADMCKQAAREWVNKKRDRELKMFWDR